MAKDKDVAMVFIEADTNDGDYVSDETNVTLDELDAIRQVAKGIKK